MQIERFDFKDPDDPITNDGKIRMTIAPEAMIIALPNGMHLGRDDQVMMGRLLRAAYEQGKGVGRGMKAKAPHNVMRFDVCLAWVYPMIVEGELDIEKLIAKVQSTIIATVDQVTEWKHEYVVVNMVGGNGNNDKPLCDIEISYDFS
jgi:hypothetical protein